jgi:TolB protein
MVSCEGYSQLAIYAWLLCAGLAWADEPERLTNDGRFKSSPIFAAENELVYVELTSPTLFHLVRMNLADRTIEPFDPDYKLSEIEPDFSANGRYFACIQTRGTLSLGVRIQDREMKQENLVPPPKGFAGYRSPTISPDGQRVVFSFAEASQQNLYSVNFKGEDRRQLTERGLNNWPNYSPDGNRIVFGSSREGNFEIYAMNADGSDSRRLTNSPYQDVRPRYSPDGRRIAFTSARDGNFEIYLMNADGSELMRLTDHPERDDYACWHPDGTRIVMVSERAGRHDLYMVRVPQEARAE